MKANLTHLTRKTLVVKKLWKKWTSREDIISSGMELAKEENESSFRIGQMIPINIIPTLNIDSVLGNAFNQVYDEVGEVAEDFLSKVTYEQEKELEELLNKVYYDWLVKHKHLPNYYKVINAEIIEVK